MRYFFVELTDAEGTDKRVRAAYREDMAHMIRIPEGRAGIWSLEFEMSLEDQPPRVQKALLEEGFYVESLPVHIKR